MRCFNTKAFSGSIVEFNHDRVNFLLANGCKVPVLWLVLANESIAIFVPARFPSSIWMSKVKSGLELVGNIFVIRKHCSMIRSPGENRIRYCDQSFMISLERHWAVLPSVNKTMDSWCPWPMHASKQVPVNFCQLLTQRLLDRRLTLAGGWNTAAAKKLMRKEPGDQGSAAEKTIHQKKLGPSNFLLLSSGSGCLTNSGANCWSEKICWNTICSFWAISFLLTTWAAISSPCFLLPFNASSLNDNLFRRNYLLTRLRGCLKTKQQ